MVSKIILEFIKAIALTCCLFGNKACFYFRFIINTFKEGKVKPQYRNS